MQTYEFVKQEEKFDAALGKEVVSIIYTPLWRMMFNEKQFRSFNTYHKALLEYGKYIKEHPSETEKLVLFIELEEIASALSDKLKDDFIVCHMDDACNIDFKNGLFFDSGILCWSFENGCSGTIYFY